MNHEAKNKLLTWLVLLLLVANAATITMFWLGRAKVPPRRNGKPQEFLVKELNLDSLQQSTFELLRREHKDSAEILRAQVKQEKESFFALLKQSNVTDSMKTAAAKRVSVITEKLDLLTLNHFQQVRAICKPEQQKKFDEIINQVIEMIGHPGQPGRPNGNRPQQPGGRDGERIPPPPVGPDGEGERLPPPPPNE